MTQTTAERKTSSRTLAPAAHRCARCSRELSIPGKVVNGLEYGPECVHYVTLHLERLTSLGLRELALTGEQRIKALRLSDGTFHVPMDALEALRAIAARAGITLNWKLDPRSGEYVGTMTEKAMKKLVKQGLKA